MIRCVRIWTGEDGSSLFEEGWIDLLKGMGGDPVSEPTPVLELSFQETPPGGSHDWHQDPVPRFVISLSGTVEFHTKSGAAFTIRPGDVVLAQDNSGTGHKWKLIGDDPWRRAYIVYAASADLRFTSASSLDQGPVPSAELDEVRDGPRVRRAGGRAGDCGPGNLRTQQD
jgi:quercetin dioxygenase-like cupin family protein